MGIRRSPNSEWDNPMAAKTENRLHLGDAQLDMLALRPGVPFLRRGDALAPEDVGDFFAGIDAAAIDPGRPDWSRP